MDEVFREKMGLTLRVKGRIRQRPQGQVTQNAGCDDNATGPEDDTRHRIGFDQPFTMYETTLEGQILWAEVERESISGTAGFIDSTPLPTR